ncbi:cardiolipin synthase [Desulfothermus sp.]
MSAFTYFIALIIFLFQIASALHALFYKKDPRAAWVWIIVCLMLPPIGPILYFLFGINRVKLKAKKIRWFWPDVINNDLEFPHNKDNIYNSSYRYFVIPPDFHQIAKISDSISKFPLVSDNNVEVLYNGDDAYPSMIYQINHAKESVFLQTYIFERKKIGKQFVDALSEAKQRGVDVRVIVDGIGEWYSYPTIGPYLRKNNIPFTRFLPPRIYPFSPLINLRNHRKILVVDGKVAFTGGINIRDKHIISQYKKRNKIQDVHFKLTGPIVGQLEQIFIDDWLFCTGEKIKKRRSLPEPMGEAICRCITVGPDDDLNSLTILLVGAISLAKEYIYIMTPYFLPNREIIGALQSAALRGVDVRIILPEKNNIPYVHWATRNMLWELLMYGVKIYFQPPPFCHSKIFVLDEFYSLIGSANLDYRSLRLNFELVVETFCKKLATKLTSHISKTVQKSREITLHEVDSRPFLEKLRDSVCWLFTPYL